MDKISIGLSRPKDKKPFSEAIMWAEDTNSSHIFIRRKSKNVGNYIYQASGLAVNFMGESIFEKYNYVVEEYEFNISEVNLQKLIRFFIKNSGKKYSINQVLVLARLILMEKLGFKPNYDKIVNGNEEWICSELGAIVMEVFLNIDDIPNHKDLLTPGKLAPYIRKYGKLVRYEDKVIK